MNRPRVYMGSRADRKLLALSSSVFLTFYMFQVSQICLRAACSLPVFGFREPYTKLQLEFPLFNVSSLIGEGTGALLCDLSSYSETLETAF